MQNYCDARKTQVRNSVLLRDVLNNNVVFKNIIKQSHNPHEARLLLWSVGQQATQLDEENIDYQTSKLQSKISDSFAVSVPVWGHLKDKMRGSRKKVGLTTKDEKDMEALKTTLQHILQKVFFSYSDDEIYEHIKRLAKDLNMTPIETAKKLQSFVEKLRNLNFDDLEYFGQRYFRMVERALEKHMEGSSTSSSTHMESARDIVSFINEDEKDANAIKRTLQDIIETIFNSNSDEDVYQDISILANELNMTPAVTAKKIHDFVKKFRELHLGEMKYFGLQYISFIAIALNKHMKESSTSGGARKKSSRKRRATSRRRRSYKRSSYRRATSRRRRSYKRSKKRSSYRRRRY